MRRSGSASGLGLRRVMSIRGMLGRLRHVRMVIMTIRRMLARLMATTDPIISTMACSSVLAPGSVVGADIMAEDGMILATDIADLTAVVMAGDSMEATEVGVAKAEGIADLHPGAVVKGSEDKAASMAEADFRAVDSAVERAVFMAVVVVFMVVAVVVFTAVGAASMVAVVDLMEVAIGN